VLQNRHFILLWVVNITTTLAIELLSVTILVSVFEYTGSTLQAAGIMVARTLVPFLLGPMAGVFVDRFPRKNVLISMDFIRLVLVGMSVWLLGGDEYIPVIGLYLILSGLSAAGVFHQPACLSLIPSLVKQDELVKANSFIFVSNQIMLAISFITGGWLIQTFPLRLIAVGVIFLFIIAIIAALFMVVPKRVEEEDVNGSESFWTSLVSGWQYLRRHPIAKPLTVMETLEHVPHGIWTGALMLAFTIQALGGDSVDWGYQATGYYSGLIVGSLGAFVITNWLNRYPGRLIVLNACVSGLFTLAFAYSPTVWMATVWSFLFGPPFAIRDIAQDSLLQGTVSEGQLGRVYATREMLRSIVYMLAGLFFAWLSELMHIRVIFIIGGILYLLTGVYALNNKALRESNMNIGLDVEMNS
jgi:DHA3 family macrolide efflux protein-like MFS transporter